MKTNKKNGTVKAEGVFCGSQKFPQNVGNDDWADKARFLIIDSSANRNAEFSCHINNPSRRHSFQHQIRAMGP